MNIVRYAVAVLDRVFYIRVTEGEPQPEFPRSATDAIDLEFADTSAVWYVITADVPMDAWALVRDSAETSPIDRTTQASSRVSSVTSQRADTP